MTSYSAEIVVTLRPVVNDPQGLTIAGGLHSLGFDKVRGVRAGKIFTIVLEAVDESSARNEVDAMCQQLLANPVIEDYRFELQAG